MWQIWQRMKRRPQLAIVATAGIFVLVVAILTPVVGPRLRARLQPPVSAQGARAALATPSTPPTPRGTIFQASPHVHAVWSDSTALVTWDAIPGAAGYVVTLIRSRDLGIIERYTVPASQLAGDAQGVWPNESYQVAIQPLRPDGAAGAPEYSAPGHSVPISRQTYNGFLDTEGRPAGPIDYNLWDQHIFYSNIPMEGVTFVNDQLHYHILAGCPSSSTCFGRQTITAQNARVPVDWTNRTATIHGEVDLKGDFHQWFGVVLSPQIIGPDRVLDEVDRFNIPLTMPQLELFTFQGRTRLLYAAGDGSHPQELASIPNPRGLNNVRDDIVWHVSATHTTIVIDGQTAFDLNWPAPLGFTHGYLSLFAEDYPNSGGTNGQPACDQPGQDCSVWHLDNWGFDAPAGQVQPTSHVYYAQGCGPYTNGSQDQEVQAAACDSSVTGSTSSVSVPGVGTNKLIGASVVFDVQRLHTQGALTVAVNGHAARAVPYVASDRNTDDFQSYAVSIPAGDLVSGTNTVQFQLNASMNNGDQVDITNVQIQTLSSIPYTPPSLPPDPSATAYWH